MEKNIHIKGAKIERITISVDDKKESEATYKITILAKDGLDNLEFAMGAESTLNNAGFKDRHLRNRMEFDRRHQDLPIEKSDTPLALTIRHIPASQVKRLCGKIITSLQFAGLLSAEEERRAQQRAGITFRDPGPDDFLTHL